MAEKLTLMAVHAHPDDESSSTGGVLATYSGQGIRTVVVTCTNGEFGDAPGGVKPGEDGHDEQAASSSAKRVAATAFSSWPGSPGLRPPGPSPYSPFVQVTTTVRIPWPE